MVPVHTDGVEYTLEGTLRSERCPALENLSFSSQEGLFPPVFGAKKPFPGLEYHPATHFFTWTAGTVQESVSVPGNVVGGPTLVAKTIFSFSIQCYTPKSSCTPGAE